MYNNISDAINALNRLNTDLAYGFIDVEEFQYMEEVLCVEIARLEDEEERELNL